MNNSILPFGHTGFDRFFDDFERDFFPGSSRSSVMAFRTDIQDKGDSFLLEAELPGFEKGDIDVDLHEGVLTITAKHSGSTEQKDGQGKYLCRERRVGSVQRSFNVSGIKEHAISAAYENGILRLTLPKMTAEDTPRRKITIQ